MTALDPQPQYELSDPLSFSDKIRPGPLAGIQIDVSMTTDTGETLAPIDVADKVQLNRGGGHKAQESFDWFARFLQKYFGSLVQTTPTAGDSRVTGIIPMFAPERPQVAEIGSGELDLNIDFNDDTLDTRSDSNGYTVEITPLYAEMLRERYDLIIRRDTLEQDDEVTYDEDNIVRLTFEEETQDSNDRITVTVDGDQKVGHGADLQNLAIIQALTAAEETDTLPTLIDYSLIQSGRMRDAINSQTTIELDGTTGKKVDITRMRMDGATAAGMSMERARSIFRKRARAQGASGSLVLDEDTREQVAAAQARRS
jgi:hypothetical protein